MNLTPFTRFALAGCGLLALLLGWLLLLPPASWRAPGPDTLTLPAAIAADPLAADAARDPALAKFIATLRRLLSDRDARAHEALLSFKDDESFRRFETRARAAGVKITGKNSRLRTARVQFADAAALRAELLPYLSDLADLGANTIIHIPDTPAKDDRAAVTNFPVGNDTLALLGVTGPHDQWGRGLTIAILDTGVAADPTLAGRIRALDIGLGLAPGSGATDGHGTAVASLAAGLAADAPGTAPAATILSIRVTGPDGTSDLYTLAHAIVTAVDAGAQIINVSLGGYATATALTAAIDYAVAHGAVIVAAAGNDQAAQLTWPAADPRVVSVGATDALEQQVSFSNSGSQLSLTAPGYGVQSAWLDSQRVWLDGTSASAPLVAGAIAAVMSQSPGLTAAAAAQVLRTYSSDGGAPGADADYGSGILNLGWAINRTDATRADTAVSSLYYDPAGDRLQFVVQNRGAQTVAGLTLTVDTNGATATSLIPPLAAGATAVFNHTVTAADLVKAGTLTFRADLKNPPGVADQVPANNKKTSQLTAPVPKP